jgi:H+-transporting ATPase
MDESIRPTEQSGSSPSGGFDSDPEKSEKKPLPPDEDDEEEDVDALIEELESQDGNVDDDDEGGDEVGGARPVPEELLQTDTRQGLTDADVLARRRKYGLNQMKEEKENLILKFFGYFVGPIQFVMEVSISPITPIGAIGRINPTISSN